MKCFFVLAKLLSLWGTPLSPLSAFLLPYKVSKLTVMVHKYAGTLATTSLTTSIGGTA